MKRFQLLFQQVFPYVIAFAAVFCLIYFGSINQEDTPVKAPIASNFDDASFVVTADQVSESYTVANISNTIALPSASSISENYVTVSSLYETTGTTTTTYSTLPEKQTIIDTSDQARGIIEYTIEEGDSVESIANKYGISKDQLRWSNGLKDESITVGNTIKVPTVAGIVYKVKEGDTIDSLAEKYQSDKDLIIAYNDLENSSPSTDSTIILPNGVLPEKERPEYVPPKPVVVATPTTGGGRTYSYATDSGQRHGMVEVGSYGYWSSVYNSTRWQHNPGAFGNCTWFAWYWRRNNMGEDYWLPTGTLGNARAWVSTLGGRYYTGRTPAYGAVIQSTNGYYGHVGVVVGVVEGEYITIQEMNYAGPNGKFNHVYQSTINWGDALGYNYIYGKK